MNAFCCCTPFGIAVQPLGDLGPHIGLRIRRWDKDEFDHDNSFDLHHDTEHANCAYTNADANPESHSNTDSNSDPDTDSNAKPTRTGGAGA